MNRTTRKAAAGSCKPKGNCFSTRRPRGRQLALMVMAAFLLLPWPESGRAADLVEAHHYTETTQSVRQRIEWRLERQHDYILTSTTAEEVSVCRIAPSFDTHQWQVRRRDQDTRMTARREAHEIHLSGTLEGATIQRTLKIDDAPWYQAGSLSLRAFVQSDQERTRFWILRPGKFTAHKLQAIREGVDALEVDGRTVSAHKIKVCLTGWKAPFWSATYWFRAADGVFLRYEGASGPPGAPETVVEWVPTSDI